jgi:hypothetical protein
MGYGVDEGQPDEWGSKILMPDEECEHHGKRAVGGDGGLPNPAEV